MGALASIAHYGRLLPEIGRQIAQLARNGPNGARVDMSKRFLKLTIRCFEVKQTPDGKPWAPPKDIHNVDLLVRSGKLRDGNRAFVEGSDVGVRSTDWKTPFQIKDNKLPKSKGIRPGRPWLLPGTMPYAWSVEAKHAISLQFWKFMESRR